MGATIMADDSLPPLPDGATLDTPQSLPPLPSGATLDKQQTPDNSWSNKANRFATGALDLPTGLAQGAAHLTGVGTETADSWASKLAQREARLKSEAGIKPNETDWYGTAGSIAPSLLVPEAGIASKAGLAADTLGGMAARGAIGGAGFGAAQPVNNDKGDYWSQKGAQTATGALAGGVGAPAIGLAGRAIKPSLDSSAQKLVDAGVNLTPGQMMGGAGKWLEDSAQSYPFVGGLIRSARKDSGEEFQRATANKVLEPIGERIDPKISAGPDLIEHVEDKIGAKYDQIHPNINLTADQDLKDGFEKIVKEAAMELPEDKVNQLQKFIDGRITGVLDANKGVAPGPVVQGMTSKIGSKIRDYRTAADPDQRALGTYFADVRQAVGQAIERQNPQYAEPLREANQAWQMYAKMRDAASRQGTGTGEFNPTQLELASKRGESVGTKAKGQAKLQDFAQAGKDVIPSKVPDSGTAERSALLHLLGIGGHYGAYSALGPASLAPAAAIAALYNPVGQAAARYAIKNGALMYAPASQAVRDILEQNAPRIASRLPLLSNGSQ